MATGKRVNAVDDVSLADADLTYDQNEVDLINGLKSKVNELLGALRESGLLDR